MKSFGTNKWKTCNTTLCTSPMSTPTLELCPVSMYIIYLAKAKSEACAAALPSLPMIPRPTCAS